MTAHHTPITIDLDNEHLETLRQRLPAVATGGRVLLNLSKCRLDDAGAELVVELVTSERARGVRVALLGLQGGNGRALVARDREGHIAETFAVDELDALHLLETAPDARGKDRLVRGVSLFRSQVLSHYEPLYMRLARGQKPHTLFVTCSDSRIDPNLVTSTDPGELFIVRNVGNLVPRAEDDDTPAEGAAVEYALAHLAVEEIVVCGHSGCGAMKAILAGADPSHTLPSLERWLAGAADVKAHLPPAGGVDDLAKLNVLYQIENLLSYRIVSRKLVAGEVHLHGWFYDLEKGLLEEWNAPLKRWSPVGTLATSAFDTPSEK